MPARSICLLAILAAAPAEAAALVPHRAVYDLSLAEQSEDLLNAEGRIAIELKAEDCESYSLDFRFVARFGQEGEVTLVDQRIQASEGQDGTSYTFESWSFVDGLQQSHVRGSAQTLEDETEVTMKRPVERSFALPASRFPLGQTAHLIERARAGERIVESRLYDGDEDGENLLTTTAVILPAAGDDGDEDALSGLDRWRVDESHFNEDSRADGLPIFHTRYTLFENGVSDDLYLDFGEYALEGGLSELKLGERPADCP